MSDLSYKRKGLIIKKGGSRASDEQIRDLQNDLRSLGYLKEGIDSKFGNGTQLAVKSLQYDLMHNTCDSTQRDGKETTVRVTDYNKQRVLEVNGEVDENLAACINDMLEDPDFPKPEGTDNPERENKKVMTEIKSLSNPPLPLSVFIRILKQEITLQNYNVTSGDDQDSYIKVGFSRN